MWFPLEAVRGLEYNLQSQTTWVEILPPSLINYVGTLFNHPIHFSYLTTQYFSFHNFKITATLQGGCEKQMKKHVLAHSD